MPKYRPLQIKTTDADREEIAVSMKLFPHLRDMASVHRYAIIMLNLSADPVQLEQARRTVRRARKQEAQS